MHQRHVHHLAQSACTYARAHYMLTSTIRAQLRKPNHLCAYPNSDQVSEVTYSLAQTAVVFGIPGIYLPPILTPAGTPWSSCGLSC